MTAWWRDGVMVVEGDGGSDQHFVADAASEDDAQRLIDWHNAALRDHSEDIDALTHDALSYAAAFMNDPDGLAHKREAWLVKVHDALVRASTPRTESPE